MVIILGGEIGSINKIMYQLYKTTNTINGKYYIGVTGGKDKWYKGSGTALKRAIKKHGSEHFITETLETFTTEQEAFTREAEVVNEEFVANRDTYNMKVGGKGGTGQKKSKEHKRKISEAIKAKWKHDKEYRHSSENAGRKPAMDSAMLLAEVKEHGIKGAAVKLGLTYYQCRDRYYRYRAKD